jgi:hypothetical protein
MRESLSGSGPRFVFLILLTSSKFIDELLASLARNRASSVLGSERREGCQCHHAMAKEKRRIITRVR